MARLTVPARFWRRRWWWFAAAAVCALVAAVVWVRSSRERFAAEDDPASATIFVSIASYRDADCINTLHSLFSAAANPARVFVGVCEQNSPAAAETCLPAEFKWHDQVRRVSVPSKEAKGPTYARYLCSTLHRGERYFLQLDSHMRMVKGWDTAVIAMLRACPSPKPVLTHYPHDSQHAATGIRDVPVLCKSKFDAQGLATFEADTLPPPRPGATPKPVPFTAGGFMFGPATMLSEVPYDPDLPQLFQGEELLYSARLWTAGYDFFTPTANLCYHHYYRKDAPKFWNDVDYTATQQATVAKVKKLLDGGMPGYSHGLGTARSLAQYWAFAGIDWAAKTSASAAKFCT